MIARVSCVPYDEPCMFVLFRKMRAGFAGVMVHAKTVVRAVISAGSVIKGTPVGRGKNVHPQRSITESVILAFPRVP